VLVVGRTAKDDAAQGGRRGPWRAGDYSEERARYATHVSRSSLLASRRNMGALWAHRSAVAKVAGEKFPHARLNPLAQMRETELTFDRLASRAIEPSIAPPLKFSDCSQITTARPRWFSAHDVFSPSSVRATRRLLAMATRRLSSLERKDIPVFPIAAKAASQAYKMAGSGRMTSMGGVHDCFSISEIVQYELLGFAATGKGAYAARKRRDFTALRPCPVKCRRRLAWRWLRWVPRASVRLYEAYQHLTDRAGARQIEGAKAHPHLQHRRSLTTTVVMIWEGTGTCYHEEATIHIQDLAGDVASIRRTQNSAGITTSAISPNGPWVKSRARPSQLPPEDRVSSPSR